ncbi:MAG: UPF0175 family protein [Armatimonadetes bacterium]|nr:UPF0175 family protein [Armatimonadota bacterium]
MPEPSVTIPAEWAEELEPYRDRLAELLLLGLSQMRRQEALLLYRRGVVSFGRAAEMARMPEPELSRYAAALGVAPRYEERMVGEELA